MYLNQYKYNINQILHNKTKISKINNNNFKIQITVIQKNNKNITYKTKFNRIKIQVKKKKYHLFLIIMLIIINKTVIYYKLH